MQFAICNSPAPLPAAEPQRLTTDGQLKFSPVFINEGRELVYVVLEKPELQRLMRLDLATGKTAPLHENPPASEFEPGFSPDSRYISFVQNRGTLSMALVIRDRQEKKDAEIPPPGGFAGPRSPAIAPDKSRVVYSLAEEGRQHLFSVNIEAQDRKQLTDSNGINNWPCFSPDGREIVFGSTRDGNFDLYVMLADGTNVRQLTDNPYQDLRPRYSPDGSQIAFTSNRDRNYELYVMRADGSDQRRITTHPERDDYPAWHPDGRRLAAICERNGHHDVYLIDVP